MSLFGRIKSAVVGNPVTKEYELGRHIASAGPGLMWKVYSAAKKSTRQVRKCTVLTCMQPYSRYMYIEATIVLETDYLSITALYMYNVVVPTYTV